MQTSGQIFRIPDAVCGETATINVVQALNQCTCKLMINHTLILIELQALAYHP